MLSPLESVSDVGFRSLCASLGAGMTWTEMIRAQALAKNNRSAMDLIDTYDDQSIAPTGIQLLAKTPKDLQQALQHIEQSVQDDTRPYYNNAIAIDLNFGCPSPAILKEGAGPVLLKRRKRLSELFGVLAEWKHTTKLPIGAIGCKIRLGLNQSEVNNKVYLDVADIAVSSGLDYMTVHARHGAQRSSVPADWAAIREVKERTKGSNICIIGNGDVYTVADAGRMLSETGCDGVMIARGAIKNPWIFKDIANIIKTGADISFASQSGITAVPTIQEVEMAERAYMNCARLRDTKAKYVDFHSINFRRLKQVASGKGGIPFEIPRNQHIS